MLARSGPAATYNVAMPRGPTLHLVDASPYVFRAYFSIPPSVTAPDGRPVNAVHGFASFLLRLLGEERVSHLAVAFDRSLTTSFRNELYPQYKAQRELPPAELEAQLTDCEELASALGAAVFADERYEADDLIATLAARLRGRVARLVVVSSDKDLAQLVDARTRLHDFARAERLGPREVRAKFGVDPAQIPDYLGLAGDAVDNIPGVKGVGAKTAGALLARFGDLDTLYQRLDEVGELDLRGAGTLATKLEAGRELAFLSRELATLARDAPARATLTQLRLRRPEVARVEALCERLGSRRLRDRLLARE
jgi:5'-3' exonuclease